MHKKSHQTKSSGAPGMNRDPISGTPGAHPIGTGTGAAGGAVAGAVIGAAVGGPIGTAVGGVAGAITGGLAGKGVAEAVNPTAEDAYWRENYSSRPYASAGMGYDTTHPAYRYGWESRSRNAGKDWKDVERDLGDGWDKARGSAKMAWEDAKAATHDAWDRLERDNERMDDDGATQDEMTHAGSSYGSSKRR